MKDLARDIIALGGIPFFAIVIVRIIILDTLVYLSQFLIAGSLFFIATFFFRNNFYSGLSLIALVFTSIVYNDLRYTIFGGFVYLLLLVSLFYLKYDKKKIIWGVFFGVISAISSYFAVDFIFKNI